MPIKMYDLAGAEPDRRFSPYCWRTKMALAHKGLAVETMPWRFSDKAVLAFANWERVPVIVDAGKPVVDSPTIASYLESAYPDHPSLFGGTAGASLTRFHAAWTDTVISPVIARMVVLDILNHLEPKDKDYFRRSREARLGARLEDIVKDRDTRLPAFRQLLEPLRQTLATQPYLGGDAPLYADYIVFGSFMWARSISAFRLLEPDDPVEAWRQRLLDAFGGLARQAPGYW